MDNAWILEESKRLEGELSEVRRALHKIPEIGDALPRTKAFVCEYLERLGVPYRMLVGCDGVDAVYAVHVGNLGGDFLSSGELAILPGPVSAGKNKFTITVHGKGTHSAFPERGVDPILIAARIVNGCEELLAREVAAGTAAVLSFGSLHAGEDHNTIPETAVIKGSIRCQNPEIRGFLRERLREIATSIAAAYRARCEVDLKNGSSTVVNDARAASLASSAVSELFPEEKVCTSLPTPLMGSDDFANYAQRIPAVYFLLHTNNEEKEITEANHSPRFDLDEDVLWEGVAACASIALRFLSCGLPSA